MARHTLPLCGALLVIALSLCAQPIAGSSAQQDDAAQPGKTALTIHLERLRAGHAEAMRPDHVFAAGDIVRFRLTSAMDGYLYVIDQGSSGSYTVLFPAPGSQETNSIRKAGDYFVPSTGDGWFQVEGPAGFDTVYFLLSPTPLGITAANPAGTPSHEPPPSSLKPRCNDAIFQARGECIDSSAGPAPLARGAPLPPQITAAAPTASRDIVLVTDDSDESVSVATPAAGPVVYTFRLAHQ